MDEDTKRARELAVAFLHDIGLTVTDIRASMLGAGCDRLARLIREVREEGEAAGKLMKVVRSEAYTAGYEAAEKDAKREADRRVAYAVAREKSCRQRVLKAALRWCEAYAEYGVAKNSGDDPCKGERIVPARAALHKAAAALVTSCSGASEPPDDDAAEAMRVRCRGYIQDKLDFLHAVEGQHARNVEMALFGIRDKIDALKPSPTPRTWDDAVRACWTIVASWQDIIGKRRGGRSCERSTP